MVYTNFISDIFYYCNKRIINNSRALELEISKKEQYIELKKFDIRFPTTYYANNKKEIIEKSKNFTKPFITKHNRGGKGLGVKYFENTWQGRDKRKVKSKYKFCIKIC